jgi:hypothetical protein
MRGAYDIDRTWRPRAESTDEVRAEDVLETRVVERTARCGTRAASAKTCASLEERAPSARRAPRAPSPPSLAPVAISTPPLRGAERAKGPPHEASHANPRRAEPTYRIWRRGPRRKARMFVEAAMAASLLVLAATGVRARFAGGDGDGASIAPPSPEPPVSSPLADEPATGAAPAVTAASEDRRTATSTVGTLSLGPGASALVVDNAKISASSAIVPCGGHIVRVGHSKARWIDVPCGGTVILEPGGKVTQR